MSINKYLLKQCEKHWIPLKTLQAAQKSRGGSSGKRLYTCLVSLGDQRYHGLLNTGANNTLVAGRLVQQRQTQMGEAFGVKAGSGAVQLTSGETEGGVHVGKEELPFSFATFNTDAFDVILGNDFFQVNPHIKYLSLQAPDHLLVRRQGQLVEVPLNEDTKRKPPVQIIQGLSPNLGADVKLEGVVALHTQLARTGNYKRLTDTKRKGIADLSLEGELRTSKQNTDSHFYCNRKDNSAFWYHWGWLLRWKQLYANPMFS